MHPAKPGKDFERAHYVGRLVALAAMGFRREIRRVGLNHHALGGNDQRGLAHLGGIAERQYSGKRDIKAERQKARVPLRRCR